METWIGMIVTISGAALGTTCLLRLRREACPRCGRLGSRATVPDHLEEFPAGQWIVQRSRQCPGCGAVVQLHSGFTPKLSAPIGLSRQLMRH